MQLLFDAYNLQNGDGTIECKQFKMTWQEVNGDSEFKFICAPVLTRYSIVGHGAAELNKNNEKWSKMALSLTKYKTTTSASNRIASTLYSLLQESILIAHILFIDTFHSIFFQELFE